MQKSYSRLILPIAVALATFALLLVLTVPGLQVATSGLPGPIVPPPPSGSFTSGLPGPIVPPPPPSNTIATSGLPGPIVPPPPSGSRLITNTMA